MTVVHSEKLLVNSTYPDKFRKDIERRARRKGIDFILGDKLDVPPEGTVGVTTHNGKQIPDADLVVSTAPMLTCSRLLTLLLQVPAYGARPNSSFISTLDQGVVTQSGTVRVNAFLEVVRHPGVFAAGDIIDWEEQKQAVKANTHAGIVAANVLSFLEGKPLKKQYKGSPELILIPLGKVRGLSALPSDVVLIAAVADWRFRVPRLLVGYPGR